MQSIWLEEARVSGSLAEDTTHPLGLTFGGYLRSKIKCMKCLGRTEQCDRTMDLTVEIDGDINTVEEALAQFTISETLGGDDKYKCSRCKSYEKAKKKLTVIEAPNILAIVLKRFRVSHVDLETVLSVEAYILFYARHTPRGPSLLTDSSVYSDGKTKRNIEAISASTNTKKKNWRSKPSSCDWYKESSIPPHDFIGNNMVDSEEWGFSYKINPILDSSSDCSSIFSASDAGSYSTDSMKDSSVEDISGYIFGSSFYGQ